MRFWNSVAHDDRHGAAEQAMAWGYPREIEDEEVDASSWLRFGDDVIVWFGLGINDESLTPYLCIKPESRGRVASARAMTGIEIVGELLGAKFLYMFLPPPEIWEDTRYPPAMVTRRALRRYGWVDCGDFGIKRNLGE